MRIVVCACIFVRACVKVLHSTLSLLHTCAEVVFIFFIFSPVFLFAFKETMHNTCTGGEFTGMFRKNFLM